MKLVKFDFNNKHHPLKAIPQGHAQIWYHKYSLTTMQAFLVKNSSQVAQRPGYLDYNIIAVYTISPTAMQPLYSLLRPLSISPKVDEALLTDSQSSSSQSIKSTIVELFVRAIFWYTRRRQTHHHRTTNTVCGYHVCINRQTRLLCTYVHYACKTRLVALLGIN